MYSIGRLDKDRQQRIPWLEHTGFSAVFSNWLYLITREVQHQKTLSVEERAVKFI